MAKKLRKNASLEALAKKARAKTKAIKRLWNAGRELERVRILEIHERSRFDAIEAHFYDLLEITEHLERLAGITEEKTP